MNKLSKKSQIVKTGIIALSIVISASIGIAIGAWVQEERAPKTFTTNTYPQKKDRVLAFSEVETEVNGNDTYNEVKDYYLCDGYDLHVNERIADKGSLEVYEDPRLGLGIKYGNCFLDQYMIAEIIGADSIELIELQIYSKEACGGCWDGFAYIAYKFDQTEAPTKQYGIYNLEWSSNTASKEFNPEVQIKFGEDVTTIQVSHHDDMCKELVEECLYSDENGSGIYEFTFNENQYEIERTGEYIEIISKEDLMDFSMKGVVEVE
jgi:hypothetical protein